MEISIWIEELEKRIAPESTVAVLDCGHHGHDPHGIDQSDAGFLE